MIIKIKFTGCPNAFHGMGIIANIVPGRPTLGGMLCRTVKMDELQVVGHIYICNFITFSVRLDSQRHAILKSEIALTLQHQILSGKCPSHIIPGLSKRKQYTWIHFHASVLSILCHERHWPRRNIDLCNTAKRYSTMFMCMYDHPFWWDSIIIIKNKPEPSNLHGIVPRLHTLINLHEVMDHIMAG